MRHIPSSELDTVIDGVIVTMKKHFHDDVLSGDVNVAEYHAYRRLADDVVFDDSERKEGVELGGRFAGLLPPHPPPAEAVAMMRQLIALGAAGDLRVVER